MTLDRSVSPEAERLKALIEANPEMGSRQFRRRFPHYTEAQMSRLHDEIRTEAADPNRLEQFTNGELEVLLIGPIVVRPRPAERGMPSAEHTSAAAALEAEMRCEIDRRRDLDDLVLGLGSTPEPDRTIR